MAKKSSIEKQKRRAEMVKRSWEKRQELKKKVYDMSLPEEERHEARLKLNALPKNGSPVRLRNRCLVTGRARGYHRKFKLSRLCLREMASRGEVPGVTKASW